MQNLPPYCLIEEFDKVEAFLSALAMRDERWGPIPREWIFRGQGNRAWNLVPSALRPNAEFPHGSGRKFQHSDDILLQVSNEFGLILEFAEEVNRQGLTLPSEESYRWLDVERRFRELRVPDPDTVYDWPWPEIAPLIALAQHYGIPTRLLDWTERPLVAAYFAALQAIGAESTGALSVWALHPGHTEMLLSRGPLNESRVHLRVIRAPRATNPNLHAQAGIFTTLNLLRRSDEYVEFNAPALDQLLEQKALLAASGDNVPLGPLVWRLDLPAHFAGRLLWMLADEGISATTLHPGYEGVVRGLKEREHWRWKRS